MKKTVVKAPAKINITLDILGTEGKYRWLKLAFLSRDK